MLPHISSFLAIGPFGTAELLIIAVLMLVLAAMVGGVVFLTIYLSKKK